MVTAEKFPIRQLQMTGKIVAIFRLKQVLSYGIMLVSKKVPKGVPYNERNCCTGYKKTRDLGCR